MQKATKSKPTGGANITAGPASQYLKKGGKVTAKKMMAGGKAGYLKGGSTKNK